MAFSILDLRAEVQVLVSKRPERVLCVADWIVLTETWYVLLHAMDVKIDLVSIVEKYRMGWIVGFSYPFSNLLQWYLAVTKYEQSHLSTSATS